MPPEKAGDYIKHLRQAIYQAWKSAKFAKDMAGNNFPESIVKAISIALGE